MLLVLMVPEQVPLPVQAQTLVLVQSQSQSQALMLVSIQMLVPTPPLLLEEEKGVDSTSDRSPTFSHKTPGGFLSMTNNQTVPVYFSANEGRCGSKSHLFYIRKD